MISTAITPAPAKSAIGPQFRSGWTLTGATGRRPRPPAPLAGGRPPGRALTAGLLDAPALAGVLALAGADLVVADLVGADLAGAVSSGAVLAAAFGVAFAPADFAPADFAPGAFAAAALAGVALAGAAFEGVAFAPAA